MIKQAPFEKRSFEYDRNGIKYNILQYIFFE